MPKMSCDGVIVLPERGFERRSETNGKSKLDGAFVRIELRTDFGDASWNKQAALNPFVDARFGDPELS